MNLPLLDWPRAGVVAVTRAIETALAQGRGFSLIRLGDGEGAMLEHDNPASEVHLPLAVETWFGDQPIAPHEIAEMTAALEIAIANADVLGLPRLRQIPMTLRYAVVFTHTDRLAGRRLRGENPPLIGDAALHFYLQWSRALGRIVPLARRVILIGCRDVADEFARQLGVMPQQWLVRGEVRYLGPVRDPHWPDAYQAMLARIGALGPGDLVIVGAGVLGKAYCEAARAQGAVAVDMGSVLDGWAGVISRPGRIEAAAPFTLAWLAAGDTGDEAMLARLQAQVAGTNIADGTL